MEKEITISFLPVKEDYIDFRFAVNKEAIQKKEITIFNILGFFLVLAGLAGAVFLSKNIYMNMTYASIALLGFIISIYYTSIQPLLIKRRAVLFFEQNENGMVAQTIQFTQDGICVNTDPYQASLPYGVLYKAFEDSKIFVLYTGIGEMRFIPKRALTKEECQKIQEILKSQLQEKYKQEGAH